MSDTRGDEQPSVTQRFRENATGIVSTLVTGIWLGAMFTGQSWWLAALIIGYVAVVPVTAMLFGDEEEAAAAEAEADSWRGTWDGSGEQSKDVEDEETPLEALRRRYAEGELTDEQFERKLEALLDTETIEDADEHVRRRETERER